MPSGELVEKIRVLRPRLPSAEQLLPYLRRIDATRVYSNHGPLCRELERRLSKQLRLPADNVVCASSGTIAIVGAILAVAARAKAKPLAVVPALTFVATASAVEQCGYEPYLADVDPQSWMLDPKALAQHPLLDRVGLVVPVAPFGRPVPQQPWSEFRRRTKVPVVIDGAASFDTILRDPHIFMGEIPVALSFHATKSFGTGEGGAIATSDVDLAAESTSALNFGSHIARNSCSPSTNGKMSEYHAAVGLAELDGWEAKRSALSTVVSRYKRRFREAAFDRSVHCFTPNFTQLCAVSVLQS